MDKTTSQALEIGRANAEEVISFRKNARKVEAGSAGVLVAEGDSWFNYPWTDILRLLEDEHGYDVESVAHYGDTVEEMAYSGGQLERFSRLIEKQLRRGRVPKAILLESLLSFLGLGVQDPLTSLGLLISEGAANMRGALWLLIWPALTLTLILFALNFLGDGLRDSLDPKDR